MKTLKNLMVCSLALSLLLFNLFVVIDGAQAGDFLDLERQEGFREGEIAEEYGQSAESPRDIRVVVANIIQVLLGLLGIIFVSLLIYAGFKYMTAAGNEDQTRDAKKQIMQSVIGLVIILTAYSITSFIINNVLEATKKGHF